MIGNNNMPGLSDDAVGLSSGVVREILISGVLACLSVASLFVRHHSVKPLHLFVLRPDSLHHHSIHYRPQRPFPDL